MTILERVSQAVMVIGLFMLGGALTAGNPLSALVALGVTLQYPALAAWKGYTTAGTPTPAAE